jgi:osmotically-inducible protein OsmY
MIANLILAVALHSGAASWQTAPSEKLEKAVLRAETGSTEIHAGEWSIRSLGQGAFVASREIQRVAGWSEGSYDPSALRLAVRAAVVNHLITQAQGIRVNVMDGAAILTGTVDDPASAARAIAAAATLPQVDRVEARFRYRVATKG